MIDLTAADNGELAGLDITGDLGRISTNDGFVTVDDVTGDLVIDGNLYEDFSAADITGDIIITGDIEGTLACDSPADVTVTGESNLVPVPGNILVRGAYSSAITVNNHWGGRIEVEGDSTGLIEINGRTVGVIEGSRSATRSTPGFPRASSASST